MPSYACVCIEMDMSTHRNSAISIQIGNDGFWKKIEYERSPIFCRHCQLLSHDIMNYKKMMGKVYV